MVAAAPSPALNDPSLSHSDIFSTIFVFTVRVKSERREVERDGEIETDTGQRDRDKEMKAVVV